MRVSEMTVYLPFSNLFKKVNYFEEADGWLFFEDLDGVDYSFNLRVIAGYSVKLLEDN